MCSYESHDPFVLYRMPAIMGSRQPFGRIPDLPGQLYLQHAVHAKDTKKFDEIRAAWMMDFSFSREEDQLPFLQHIQSLLANGSPTIPSLGLYNNSANARPGQTIEAIVEEGVRIIAEVSEDAFDGNSWSQSLRNHGSHHNTNDFPVTATLKVARRGSWLSDTTSTPHNLRPVRSSTNLSEEVNDGR